MLTGRMMKTSGCRTARARISKSKRDRKRAEPGSVAFHMMIQIIGETEPAHGNYGNIELMP